MNDKTLLIGALALGAFMLTRHSVAGAAPGTTAAQRLFAGSNQSPARAGINPAIYNPAQALANGQAQNMGNIGRIIGGLFGRIPSSTSTSGASLTAPEYNALGVSPGMTAEAIAYTGNGNVYDQAAAEFGKNPYGLYGGDAIAANPSPSFGNYSSPYDATYGL